jgi:hypothetical protein
MWRVAHYVGNFADYLLGVGGSSAQVSRIKIKWRKRIDTLERIVLRIFFSCVESFLGIFEHF